MRLFNVFAILMVPLTASVCVAQIDATPANLGQTRTSDGTIIMGSTATLVRVSSSAGPILAMDLAGMHSNGKPRGIYGRMCQRWLSSQSNSVYDVPTPGFSLVLNNQTVESLDAHFVTPPTSVTVTSLLEEGNVDFPGGNPLPSTPSVGYGIGHRFFFDIPTMGYLRGAYEIPASANVTSLNLAYVPLGGTIDIRGAALLGSGWAEFQFSAFVPDIPEPATLALLVVIATLATLRRGVSCNEGEMKRGSGSLI